VAEAFICSAVRSAVGKKGGGLAAVHPADLAAEVLGALITRSGVDPALVDDVFFGCVSQIGGQATNVGRTAWLSAGLPESVPATTIDRQCGSSQQAAHFAAQSIQAGAAEMIVWGGVEVMSSVPIGAAVTAGIDAGYGDPLGGELWEKRYGSQLVNQMNGAELIAKEWEVSRDDMERFALQSHQRAVTAAEAGLFDDEIVTVAGLSRDEGPRTGASLESMQKLSTLPGTTRLTAALASPISDGAAAILVASEAAVRKYGLTPLARIHTMAVVGSDPIKMLTGPIPATELVLARSGLELDELAHIEINEAFASVVLAWQKEMGAANEIVNPLGGAIALGHPLGATGARLMTTMAHQLRRTGGQYGLQVMCEGGGMANATIIERV